MVTTTQKRATRHAGSPVLWRAFFISFNIIRSRIPPWRFGIDVSFFAPITMLVRMSRDAALWQIVLSLVIVLPRHRIDLAGGRESIVGMLMTGKKATIPKS